MMSSERSELVVGDLHVTVVRKAIKNMHLGVYPPDGHVRVAVPVHVDDEAVRLAVVDKMGWISRQQARFVTQRRQSEREMVSGESHYFLGRRYLLRVIEDAKVGRVEVGSGKHIEMHVRPDSTQAQRAALLSAFYRKELRRRISPLVDVWAEKIGVQPDGWTVRRMKTRWGSCNPESRRLLFNLELAKKPPLCIEYVVVHELVHLVEPKHTDRFVDLMDKFLPGWRNARDVLNSEPLAHETWSY